MAAAHEKMLQIIPFVSNNDKNEEQNQYHNSNLAIIEW